MITENEKESAMNRNLMYILFLSLAGGPLSGMSAQGGGLFHSSSDSLEISFEDDEISSNYNQKRRNSEGSIISGSPRFENVSRLSTPIIETIKGDLEFHTQISETPPTPTNTPELEQNPIRNQRGLHPKRLRKKLEINLDYNPFLEVFLLKLSTYQIERFPTQGLNSLQDLLFFSKLRKNLKELCLNTLVISEAQFNSLKINYNSERFHYFADQLKGKFEKNVELGHSNEALPNQKGQKIITDYGYFNKIKIHLNDQPEKTFYLQKLNLLNLIDNRREIFRKSANEPEFYAFGGTASEVVNSVHLIKDVCESFETLIKESFFVSKDLHGLILDFQRLVQQTEQDRLGKLKKLLETE